TPLSEHKNIFEEFFQIQNPERNRSKGLGLGKLCNRLEEFPEFSHVEQVLSGELIADLLTALDTLTIGSDAAEVADSSRNRFCSSRIGQLFRYNVFCKR
ncbi:MAG: hypothetical protein DRR42_27295, partial [Gammaproteobacteria bacterium]